MRNYSRRGFAAYLLALLHPRVRAQGTPPQASQAPSGTTPVACRTYRCDAVVLFLGMTVFRRAGVGGGEASLEETGDGETRRHTYFFAGGSDPKRAHGLNRLGWIRETVVGNGAAPSAADYFGVMTSSPEESFEHARKAMDDPVPGRCAFSAVSGRNVAGRSRSAVTHFEYGSTTMWSDRALIDHAQAIFRGPVDWRETAWPNSPNQPPPTFLLALATSLKQRAKRAAGRYVYNEQEYTLELDTLPVGKDRLVPVHGKIRNLHTGKESLFRLWLDAGSPSVVPVRIEYQARSFLRLTFEAVPV
uniref:DUF3108 domain-containing protein n=1 Tax=Solibacter usitatus (strain Ellin6076) TaxID=234267 RepID=Q01ZS4_SOLUE